VRYIRSASSGESARAGSREPRETARARAEGAANEHDAAFGAERIANDDIVAAPDCCDEPASRDISFTRKRDSGCHARLARNNSLCGSHFAFERLKL
jgi:hypothetical protein